MARSIKREEQRLRGLLIRVIKKLAEYEPEAIKLLDAVEPEWGWGLLGTSRLKMNVLCSRPSKNRR